MNCHRSERAMHATTANTARDERKCTGFNEKKVETHLCVSIKVTTFQRASHVDQCRTGEKERGEHVSQLSEAQLRTNRRRAAEGLLMKRWLLR